MISCMYNTLKTSKQNKLCKEYNCKNIKDIYDLIVEKLWFNNESHAIIIYNKLNKINKKYFFFYCDIYKVIDTVYKRIMNLI